MTEMEEKKINLEGMLNGQEDATEVQDKKNYEEEAENLKKDLLLALAEVENLRKRHIKEREDLQKFILSSALKELTTPFEHLFSSLSVSIPEDLQENAFVKSLFEGTTMVQREFEKVFTKLGLKRIYPLGEKFDPNFHQAVAQVEEEGKVAGIVLSVVSAGFELNGRILHPAMVVVSK
jgi:molecular chaperone GrpE